MASNFSQSSQHIRLSMPLAKFSYANTPAGNPGPIPWIHLSSHNDLFVILDPYEISTEAGTRERRYRFKVLQDPGIHEDFDLYMLACEARRAIDEVQNSDGSSKQPSITIIVKTPCLAMRYPLQDRQVRRFQVRFAKEEDFYETLKIFASVRLPFIEAGAVQPVPTSIPTPTIHPPSNITATHQPEITKDREVHNMISIQPSRNPAYREPVCSRALFDQGNPALVHHDFINAPLQASASASQPDLMLSNKTTQIKPPFHTPVFPTGDVRDASASICAQTKDMRAYTVEHPLSTYVPRPSTAPAPTTQCLDTSLPPKRDLPFERKPGPSKPESQIHNANGGRMTRQQTTRLTSDGRKATGELQAQDSSPDVDMSDAKQGTERVKKKPAPRKTRVASSRKKSTTKKTQVETPVPTVEELLQRNSTPCNDFPSTRSRINLQSLPDKDSSAITIKNGMADIRAFCATDQAQNQTEVTTNINPSPDPTTRPQSQPPQSALLSLLSNPDFAPQATLPNPTSPATAVTDFDSLPEEQRHAALETWIAQTLDDDSFIKLCQTLEGMWQRIFVRF